MYLIEAAEAVWAAECFHKRGEYWKLNVEDPSPLEWLGWMLQEWKAKILHACVCESVSERVVRKG